MRIQWLLPMTTGLLLAAPLATDAAAPVWRTAAVERGDLTATVSASGTLNAVILVEVGSQISGQVRELLADFNSEVKQGDIIARIDYDMYEAKVHQAEASLQVTQASVATQEAQVERSRADVENATAALTAAQAQTAHAELAVVDAKQDYDRKKPLFDRGVVSASDWDKAQNTYHSAQAQATTAHAQEQAVAAQIRSAEAGLKMALAQLDNNRAQVRQYEAALRQAQIDFEHTYIRAPVDGVVVNRNVNQGQTVAASLQAPTLFTIAQDLRAMQVDSSVAEADVGRVAVGQAATFTVDAFPGHIFAGKVVQIRKAPQVVQNVVTYDVVVSADNPDLKLLPGMTANLTIVVAQRQGVLMVPNAALRFRVPGQTADTSRRPSPSAAGAQQPGLPGRVIIVGQDGQPAAVPIRLGITDGSMTEMLGGDLKEGTAVIIGAPPASNPAQSGLPRLF
jgi:HlyD family secretion protein